MALTASGAHSAASGRQGEDHLLRDARGVVYLEFLIAFFPLFLIFLGVCQIALLASARVLVKHAAFSAVRSAVVVLEDSPKDYDKAPRGSLSDGVGNTREMMQALLSGVAGVAGAFAAPDLETSGDVSHGPQRGARMAPIRVAAYATLLSLAPREEDVTTALPDSVRRSLLSGLERRLAFAVDYTQMASVVTVQAARGADEIATGKIDGNAEVTVRVTYLYRCAVPFVRALLCRSLDTLLAPNTKASASATSVRKRLELAEAPGVLERVAVKGSRFAVLEAEASLPNQGAGYESPKGAS